MDLVSADRGIRKREKEDKSILEVNLFFLLSICFSFPLGYRSESTRSKYSLIGFVSSFEQENVIFQVLEEQKVYITTGISMNGLLIINLM